MSLPNFTLRVPEDETERKIISNVTKFGWHVVHIMEDETGPGYSFTVGLYFTHQHPELLMMGLSHSTTHQIFTDAVAEIAKGIVFKNGTRSDSLLESTLCKFRSVKPANYHEYLGCANWFYRSLTKPFPTLQILWPDKLGQFPDERGFDEKFSRFQVLL